MTVSGDPIRELAAIQLRAEDWQSTWRRHFRVQRVGRGLGVRPWWRRYTPRPGETVITLEPGLAFGTGQHPTTPAVRYAPGELGP